MQNVKYQVLKTYWIGERLHTNTAELAATSDDWSFVLDAFLAGEAVPDIHPQPLPFQLAEVLTGTSQWMSDAAIIEAVRKLKEAQG